jgi:predicted metal-dependent HD superfamily phosphohydrolase
MPDLPSELRTDLLARYAEPQRAYHDGRHLTEVLAAVDLLADQADDVDAVRLAAWYHDAVYDPLAAAGVNEDASAALADTQLHAAGLPDPLVRKVVRLVQMTATHDPVDADGHVLADADLAILGAARERYAEYAADVRREFAHVPDEDFARGRAAILGGLLARTRIYITDAAHDRWEQAARINLAAEIAALGH